MDWLWEWLKQPSTLRVLNVLLGYLGYQIMPELWAQIVGICVALYILIDGIYNKQPANPNKK